MKRADEPEACAAQPRQGQQQLNDCSDQHANRVGVDAIVAFELGCEHDEGRDDRDVPEQRRDRSGPEVVEAVENSDHQPGEPEQEQDREKKLREFDREVRRLVVEPWRKQRHEHRRDQDEQRRQQAERDRDEEKERGRDAKGFRLAPFFELLREDGDERGLKCGVREQAPDQIRDLERDRERAHRAANAEIVGCDDLANQPCDPRQARRKRKERRRHRQPPGARLGPGSDAGWSGCRPTGARYTSPPPHGQHPITRKAHPAVRARTLRESQPHLDREDVLPPPGASSRVRATRRAIDVEYRALVSKIDKAAEHGALHRNNAARKKARAARLRARGA